MFLYQNQQPQAGFGQPVNQEMQRMFQEFWRLFDQACIEMRIPADISNIIAQTLDNPNTIQKAFADVCNGNQYDMRQLAQDIRAYIQTQCASMVPQTTYPRNAFGGAPMAGGGSVFSSHGQQMGQPQSFGQPSASLRNPGSSAGSFASKLRGSKPQQPTPMVQPQTGGLRQPVQQEVPADVSFMPTTNLGIGEDQADVDVMDDDFINTHYTLNVRYQKKAGAPTLVSHVAMPYTFATKLQCMRFLRQHYPEFFKAEDWIVTLDATVVEADKVDIPNAPKIEEAFRKVEAKLPVIRDYESFMGQLVPTLKGLSDNQYLEKLLFSQLKKFIRHFFRNPENYRSAPDLHKWSDIGELYDKSSAFMRPWTQINPEYDKYLTNILLSSLYSAFGEAKNPVIDAFKKENRGLVASIPSLLLKHGRFTLRDHAMLDGEQIQHFATELKSNYIIRKVPYRFILTNLPQEEIVSDSPISVVPLGGVDFTHKTSIMHHACFKHMLFQQIDVPSNTLYHLTQIVGFDDDEPMSHDWIMNVSACADGSILYF